ncbi:ABC transporter permease [Williamsia sp.]|uniref:ABC transporter permease n=1 Tax=Williamsia sp. TaxID=1872085 RepID=UPI001A21EF64|nr:ABC transporter permease [Williamsia sp.]MBJ7290722.1 ABC transporter permease [Williamsia sp.]
MAGYLVRRLLNYVVLLFIATFLTYMLASLTFDPLANLLGRNPPPSAAVIDAKRAALHLNDNPVLRYFKWLGDLFTGDFGQTVAAGSVNDELWRRILVSLRLVVLGTVLGAVIGTLVGAYGAVRQYKIFDHVATIVTFVLISIPILVLAPVLKYVAVRVNQSTGSEFFQYTGETSTTLEPGLWNEVIDRAQHLVLPTLVLVLFTLGSYSRYMRSSMLDELNMDYIRTARGKGLTRGRAIFRHGFRTALIPMATLFAFGMGAVITGATFTERVFGWYGMGDWLIYGITSQDINITMAVSLFTALSVLISGMLTDIFTAALDPRVRY